jgi:carboxyl-terminal processing protease
LPKELASFDYVWDSIDQTHWDVEKVGASWDAIRDELRPKMIAAKTAAEAGDILNDLISRLGQSHFVISGSSSSGGEVDIGGSGTLGLEVRLIDDAVVVWRVANDGAAAAKGIKTGMIVASVNDKAWKDVLAAVRSASKKPLGRYELGNTATLFVRGAVGSEAKLALIDGAGASKEVVATWAKAAGTTANFGLLRGIPVEYESSEIGKSIGYVRLSMFFDPVTVSQRFKADIERFSGKSGLVFDLRGNPGGIGGMAMGLGGRLVSKQGTKLGTMISRESKLDFVLNPQPGAFTGKVAILVDGQCASTCEILAAGLEDIGRATVFGTRTAGAALPSQIEALPNGALFQHATANYVSASGRVLEHDGLTPKQIVPLTRESLLEGSDSQLAAAVTWIQAN